MTRATTPGATKSVTRDDRVAGLLLTGGASSRMGRDKTRLLVDGVTLAQRTGRILQRVVVNAFEIGPGRSDLASRSDDPLAGPLGAVCVGRGLLRERGYGGDALVVAGDLPRLSSAVLEFLVQYRAPASVVPVVDGTAQPLCARWAAADLEEAAVAFAAGERRVRWLLSRPRVTLLEEAHWRHVASADTFADVDTPEDVRRLGL